MIDICTVVFEVELDTLRQQARSIERYCQNIGLENIYVMVNDQSHIDPTWWGSLANCVQICPRTELHNNWHNNGWVSQQVLKMLGSAQSDNAWCMILDAKTFFVRELQLNNIMVDNRMATGSLPIYPVFEPSKHITDQLFGIDLPAQIGPGGVPFFVEPNMVRRMIAEVELRTGQNFADYFQQQGRLTEFILYSGYVWLVDGTFDQRYYPKSRLHPVNVCHSEVAEFDEKIHHMRQLSTHTVSVHRNAWPQLTGQQQQQYHDLLTAKGII